MDRLCDDSPANPTEWPDFEPDTLSIINTNNDVEHCYWVRKNEPSFDHFLVLNFTSLTINCEIETVTFEDEQICNVTLPYCVLYGEKECKRPSKYDDCSYHDSDDYEKFLFHAETTTKGHGLTIDYSFYECLGYNDNHVPTTPFNTVQLPLIIALSVLVIIVVICICIKYRKWQKQNEDAAYQQYVTTVTSQNTLVRNEVPSAGSSMSFEFSRSYEAVPRGAVPLFDIYELSPKRDVYEVETLNKSENSNSLEKPSRNITPEDNHRNRKEYVLTKDSSQVTYSKTRSINVAPLGYNNGGFEIE